MGSLQSLQGRVLPTSPSFWGSRHLSLGWWPPPSRLRLRLHVASPLCPCLSPSVSYKDPVPGLRATPTREDRHLRPFTPSQPQRPRFFKRSCSQVLGLGRRHAIYGATVQPLRDLSKGRPHSRGGGPFSVLTGPAVVVRGGRSSGRMARHPVWVRGGDAGQMLCVSHFIDVCDLWPRWGFAAVRSCL